MRILLVNDDGIDAPGLRIMAETLSCEHELYIVAPEAERSGFSHSVTIFRDMRYGKAAYDAVESYAISGTPADCVKFAVIHLFKDRRPDLVLSGINSGPNLGSDIMYSGTVAAASEGVFLGIPAIAVSLGGFIAPDAHGASEARQHYQAREFYTEAAGFIKRNLAALYAAAKERAGEMLLNINYPVKIPFRGAAFTKAGLNWYDDYFDESAGEGVVQLKGKPTPHFSDETDCDVAMVKQGYASITPLRLDRNHYEALAELREKVKLE